jgi:hypothetical protein
MTINDLISIYEREGEREMFDPNLMNAANARHEDRLQKSLQKYEVQQQLPSTQPSTITVPVYQRAALLAHLGRFLVAWGEWLQAHDPVAHQPRSI